jgi:FixJ family two-component response regulator
METGAAHFIAKPFTPTELLNAIKKVMEKSREVITESIALGASLGISIH